MKNQFGLLAKAFLFSTLLSSCISLTADKPSLTDNASTYLARRNNNVTISVTIPDTDAAWGNCRLVGSKEGVLGQWPVGQDEYQDTRIVQLTQTSQSYSLNCEQVDRGPNNLNIVVQEYPTLPAAAAGSCNVLCVSGNLVAVNANCGGAPGSSYCAGATCVNGFTGTAAERCVPSN